MFSEMKALIEVLGEEGYAAVTAVLIAVLILCLLLLLYAITAYIFSSLGMYTIAKRRGILNPWLAWVPIGNIWILGSLSDQYQYVAKGKIRNRCTLLLVLNILYYILYFGMEVALKFAPYGNSETDVSVFIALLGLAGVALLILIPFAVVLSVFCYMAWYDLYRSCNPDRAVTYLVLSILLNVTMPFFVFSCRNQDLGMIPANQLPGDCAAQADVV